MKQFFTPKEIAKAAGVSERSINQMAAKSRWRHLDMKARKRDGRGGGWEYHVSLLPQAAQARLMVVHSAPANANVNKTAEARSKLWADYEALSKDRKAACEARLKVVAEVATFINGGLSETAAIAIAAKHHQVSPRAVRNWRTRVAGIERQDWLAALADQYHATSSAAECDERAWAALKSDFLRPERPAFSACYRRMREAASEQGWAPVAEERALRRRLAIEVPKAVQTAARQKRDQVKNLYPAQRRDRSMLHAMEAVNMDGHKFDVFVLLPGQTTPTRVMLLALQDLYSGKMVAWRLSPSENKDTVRLVIGDMVSRHGIPDKILLDNGRAFASKWITGGAANRYRFKVRDEDPRGLLTTLGVEIIWATPYSGQSKPIERAFRDLAENIAKHPFCAGAYTGNTPDAKPENYASRAIPFAAFSEHVDRMIAEHNARPGRKAGNAHGRSFDETFSASLQDPATLVRWPTENQRSLWLLAAERIRSKKGSGEIEIYGNRYWNAALNAHSGTRVTVRFDPDHLTQPIHVYDANDNLICVAECIADTGFFDTGAARDHAAKRNQLTKAIRESARLHTALAPDTLAEIYGAGKSAPQPKPEPPRFKRIANGGIRAEPEARAEWDEQSEQAFSRAMRMIEENVIEFPGKGEKPGR
ncbi:Mu DNA-binding protein [Hoeflea marina]|uniref:Mu DNA-binding protein n=1 Tax=Hoeflea marina TaxID=274592 RepID=A0A317PG08_9HYPH|nr:transposase domain-containing protein [Hoeflea marina]PWV97734.1 Mu DNA-binding protein [Hoeflea marina]